MVQDSVDCLAAALEMLAVFEIAGSRHFDLTQTDVDQRKIAFRPGRSLAAMRLLLPNLVPLSWDRQWNLILRPEKPSYGVLAQLDDLNLEKLDRVCSKAFLLLETSPQNYQAWIAIEGGDDALVRRIVKAVGVDWNASRAVRMAGTPNCKRKYLPDLPAVKILSRVFRHRVRPEELEAAGLVAPLPVLNVPNGAHFPRRRGWPDYERCLKEGQIRKDGTPDRSVVDFFWCKLAFQWGHDEETVKTKLLEVSEKAREEWDNGNERYVERTVKAAAASL